MGGHTGVETAPLRVGTRGVGMVPGVEAGGGLPCGGSHAVCNNAGWCGRGGKGAGPEAKRERGGAGGRVGQLGCLDVGS